MSFNSYFWCSCGAASVLPQLYWAALGSLKRVRCSLSGGKNVLKDAKDA